MNAVVFFECEHCGSVSRHQRYMKGHEKKCLTNPSKQACQSCRYWFKNLPAWGRVPIKKERLEFCSHPEHDYSFVDGGYYSLDYNSKMTMCEGWKKMPAHRLHHKDKIRKAGQSLSVYQDPPVHTGFLFYGAYLPWAYMIHYGD